MAPVKFIDESHVWPQTCQFRAAQERLRAELDRIESGRWYEMTTVGHVPDVVHSGHDNIEPVQ